MSRLPACATILLAALIAVQASAAGETAKDPDLQRLSGRLAQLDADPSLGQLGDVDRLKAHQALDELAQTSPHSLDRAQALYIAERRVAAAQFAAQADLAERQLEQLDREHDRILLEASRRDADQARREAERLRLQNTARDEEAQRAGAEREAQMQQAAGIASNESDQAHALAEARAKAAALAQQEAALAAGMATGAAPARLQPPPTAREPRGPSMVLSGVAFVPGRASLRMDTPTRTRVKALVAFVLANPGAMVRVEGHTDNQGNPQANLSLSQQRADAIKNVLRAAGIPASQVQAVGLGAEQPVASNATEQGRERNRRVEVIVMRNLNQ
ncbi:MAG TPA: OmpA family protein [Xanthomonadaceae bacterium]|nr:OmpA family protein [Xanthomonadaceae bacterium]